MHNPHPGLPELEYVKPASLEEASAFLVAHKGEARPFLGGTDTFVRMRDGFWKEKYLVDIKGLDGTNVITFDPAKGLTIGSAIPMNKVSAHPDVKKNYSLLAAACDTVASYQLRNRATIVGNICNASPAGDTIGACMAYGGVLTVFGAGGVRQEPLATFFKGPGKNALQTGDIVTAITFPIPPKPHSGRYMKLGRNKMSDLSIVGVTVLAYKDAAAKSGYTFKVVLASVAPVPFMAEAAQQILAEEPVTEESIGKAAEAAMQAVKPIDDVRSSARYRSYMVRNLTRQALSEVWQQVKS
ncbi:MAG: xanthine dehydrogenase family protein subunit M [Anaerolineae bacterium]|nr:xanthine dehydrogenase family protein subunit M [Anaerolineae bacterium]